MAINKKEIEKKVIEILAEKLNIKAEKIKPESNLTDDLGMDSFGAIEVMFEVEEKFGIRIEEDDMKDLHIVKDVITYIKNKVIK